MPQFSYVAVKKSGEKVKGNIEAPTEAELRVILRSQQLRPIKITKAGVFEFDLAKIGGFGGSVSDVDILIFTRQLSILISSGIPLVQGLEIIANQMKNPAMKRMILAVKEKITGGTFLWEALKDYKQHFPDFYISMIRAGEASGSLDIMLKRLIKYVDDAYKLKKLVQGAMIYPIVIVGIGAIVIIVMLTFVIPKFEQLLKSSNQELPVPTQVVINLSHFFQHNILYMVGGIVGAIVMLRAYLKTEEGRRFFDFYILKVPLFGSVLLKVAVARFSRTMQTLLSSGINILDALDICKNAIGNKLLEENLVKMRREIETGKTMSAIMHELPIFPSMVVQMVTVGEATGNLDKMLERVAEFYEEEVQNLVGSLTKLIEPLVLVGLGGAVAGLMVAMYLPILKMSGGAGG